LFGEDVQNGELPDDVDWLGKIIQDISYNNAKNYFNFANT
jgi:glucuronate isomerase